VLKVLLRKEVLSVFIYFDYFKHPLTGEEVWKYCKTAASKEKVQSCLEDLLEEGTLVFNAPYYALKGCETNIAVRSDFEPLNEKMLRRAHWMVSFMKYIPYVRGIAISGSLSKLGARDDSDIDYFIITAENRVWFVKAIAILIKKTLFLNSHKYLCVNYLLAENNLGLDKQNRFQATEAITLMPLFGKDVLRRFYNENQWVFDFFPNVSVEEKVGKKEAEKSRKRFVERLFNGGIGNWLESKAQEAFKRHGEKRYQAQKEKEAQEGYFEYSKDAAVLFPRNFELEVLDSYTTRVNDLVPVEAVD